MFNLFYPLISNRVFELIDKESEEFKNEGKQLTIYALKSDKRVKSNFKDFFDQFKKPIKITHKISNLFTCEE